MSDISISKAVRTNLLSLQNTATLMEKTQQRLATGNKVNSALDNPSNFFTASALNSRAADMGNLLDSMASGIKVIEAANNGLTALTKNLESMQSTLRQARQDKSFQTQSFEVTDKSVINFAGGSFSLDSALKLSDAEAKAGVNAKLTSIGSSAYVGPQSTNSSEKGAGARTVLSGLSGIAANSTIKVAGVDINVGANVGINDLVTTIQTQLDEDTTGAAGKYKVTAGEGTENAGKIIIETIDTSAEAAKVEFGAGVTQAVKGSVTFNFADLPSKITVGTTEIETGSNFDTFVTHLKAGQAAGKYEVITDADKNITLQATEYGVNAPQVTGVTEGVDATTASTTFNVDLASTGAFTVAGQTVYVGGTHSTATYQIDITGTGPSTITIDGEDVTIPAAVAGDTAQETATKAADAINAFLTSRTGNPPAYTATVSSTGELTLRADAVGATTPPVVGNGLETITAQTISAGFVEEGEAPARSTATYQINITGNTPTSIKVDGVDVTIPAYDTDAATSAGNAQLAIQAQLDAATLDYTASVSDTGELILTSNTDIADQPPTIESGTMIARQIVGAPSSVTTGTAGVQSNREYQLPLSGADAYTIQVGARNVLVQGSSGTDAVKAGLARAAITAAWEEQNFDDNFTLTVSDTGLITVRSIANSNATQPTITTGTQIAAGVITVDTSPTNGATTTTWSHTLPTNPTTPAAYTVNGTTVVLPALSADGTEAAAQVTAFQDAIRQAIGAGNPAVTYTPGTGVLGIILDNGTTAPTLAGVQIGPKTVPAASNVVPGTNPAPSSATYTIALNGTAATTITVNGQNVIIPAKVSTDTANQTRDKALAAIQQVLSTDDYNFALDGTTGVLQITSQTNNSTPIPAISSGENIYAQTIAAPGLGDIVEGTPGTRTTARFDVALNGLTKSTIMVGTHEVEIAASTGVASADAAALQATLTDLFDDEGIDFTVQVSNSGVVTLTAGNVGVEPALLITSGVTQNLAQTPTAVGTPTIGDITTPETDVTIQGKIEAALLAAGQSGFEVNVSDTGAVTITSTTAGVRTAVVVAGAGATSVDAKDGEAAKPGSTPTPHTPGVSQEEVAAAKDKFTISYDGKQAEVSISGLEVDANPLKRIEWRDATVISINAQLESKGITGVEAKFDDAGKLTFVSKSAEAKTLAVSGTDAHRLFGEESVSIGSPAETGLNAAKTTDKFVEFINKKFGGQVRASNDNGKLRIENLSTKELNIGVDTNGTGVPTPVKVAGNSVRANLSTQFNELRDQLDKLSDDSSFNGINLLRGDKLKINFNESGSSSIDIQSKDKSGNSRGINAANLGIESIFPEDLDSDEKIDAFLTKLSAALSDLRSQSSTFGSNLSSVQNRQDFTKSMITTLEAGAANLTLADMNEEAANLLALQTRQSLSTSALSMASQADQNILQLLR